MKIRYLALPLLSILILFIPLMPLPAQADTNALKWSTVDTPGIGGNIIVTPSEVNAIAVAKDGTLYALDTSTSATKTAKLYQSTNRGSSWTDITEPLVKAGAHLPATKIAVIAVAPDDAATLAVVTDNGTAVYLSTSSGGTWTHIFGLPAALHPGVEQIQAVAFSNGYKLDDGTAVREIAVGSAIWGNDETNGQLWVCQLGALWPTWQNQDLTVDGSRKAGEVSAIAYPSDYGTGVDDTIIVVASTASSDIVNPYKNQTFLCLGKRDTEANTTTWNTSFSSNYPVRIGPSTSGGDDSTTSQVTSSLAPLSLDSSGCSSTVIFVSYNRDPDTALANNVYRIDGLSPIAVNLNANNSGTPIDISSIKLSSGGKLLVGDADGTTPTTVQVRWPSDLSSTPTWSAATLLPTGPGNAKVDWSPDGSIAYCGTGQTAPKSVAQDQSAFSTSTDDGKNWQQQSLMDLTFQLDDLAVTPDSKTVFMATYDADPNRPEGVWRTTLTDLGLGYFWTRQLIMNTTSKRIFLRLSPNYLTDSTIYAVEADGWLLYVSHTRGNSWKKRLTLGATVDGVAVSENTFYIAMVDGKFSRTDDGGLTWSLPVTTGITNINMMTTAENGTVILVGGRNGEVAYSTNHGASFSRIIQNLGVGDIQVTADANFPQNNIIYASTNATDSGIWRFQIGVSVYWEQIDKSITNLGAGQRVDGLLTGPEGTLYALRAEALGGMSRSLHPTALETNVNTEFNVAAQGLAANTTFDSSAVFTHTLPFLRFSTETGQNELWSIDTTNQLIYRYEDTLATNSPPLVKPVNAHLDMVNSVTGRAMDIMFSWKAPCLNVTGYEAGIYADAACTVLLRLINLNSTGQTMTLIVGPNQPASTNQCIEFVPSTTYYWRVRVITPIKSQWSPAYSFSIEPIHGAVASILSPLNGAIDISRTPSFSWSPMSGASCYQLELSGNASFGSPIINVQVKDTGFTVTDKLDYGRTYFWRVRPVSQIENDWSTIANFTVVAAPTEASPPIVVAKTTEPAITFTQTNTPIVVVVPSLPPTYETPITYWVIIGVISLLVVVLVILITGTKRKPRF